VNHCTTLARRPSIRQARSNYLRRAIEFLDLVAERHLELTARY
jgi:hypothetical protein